jgi:Erv1 / Alr family
MRPEIWGHGTWVFLHSITLEYPDHPTDKDKQNMRDFINALEKVLPCDKCKYNFEVHLQEYPLDEEALSSKKNLIKWMINIHNCVNKMNGKKTISHENALRDILSLYEHTYFNAYNYKNLINFFILIFVIIFIIVIIIYL